MLGRILVAGALAMSAATASAEVLNVTFEGNGDVATSPAGIDCGASGGTTCSFDFPYKADVEIVATPAPGNFVNGMESGSCDVLNPGCTIRMNSDRDINVVFSPEGTLPTPTLLTPAEGTTLSVPAPVYTWAAVAGADRYRINITGSGGNVIRYISLAPSKVCDTATDVCTYVETNDDFLLTEDSYSWFIRAVDYTNSLGSTAASGTFSVAGLVQSQLIVQKSAGAKATVVSKLPKGVISCGTRCSATFYAGQVVKLVAKQNKTWRFSSWEGVCPEDDHNNACFVTIGVTDTTAIANFKATALDRPTGLAPDETTAVENAPVMSWNSVTGATMYRLKVYQYRGTKEVIVHDIFDAAALGCDAGGVCSYDLSLTGKQLIPGAKYLWYVAAENDTEASKNAASWFRPGPIN